jgi:RecB family exonuclease
VFINLTNQTAIEARRSAEDLRAAELKIAEIAAEIAAGEFEPNPGSRCFWCSYNSICPTQEEPLPRPLAAQTVTVH